MPLAATEWGHARRHAGTVDVGMVTAALQASRLTLAAVMVTTAFTVYVSAVLAAMVTLATVTCGTNCNLKSGAPRCLVQTTSQRTITGATLQRARDTLPSLKTLKRKKKKGALEKKK